MDVSIYLMHCGSKSPRIISVVTGTELSRVHEGLSTVVLTRGVEGLLATLFVRLCLLRALDCSPHKEQMLINVFYFQELFPYECGKCRTCSMNCCFCIFVCVYSLTAHLQTLGSALPHCSL